MLKDIINGLQQNDRGKLIAACGTGKTLVALWVSESQELNASKVLVFAPSISLVGQTVREWVEHRKRDFEYLCVCSDKTIVADIEDDGESSDIDVDDLDFSVTTTPDEIVQWLNSTSDKRQYIFSTYQSIPVIEEAMKRLGNFKFDLAIFDEAHRTVGREDQFFSRGLLDENVPVVKRLFMTATERLVNPAVKTYAKKSGVVVFSMDDESKYGPTLHDFNFGKAIESGVIADYEIVLAIINGEEELELIKNNAYVFLDEEQKEKVTLSADLLFKAGFLIKTLVAEEVHKVITFHRSRKQAVTFDRALDLISQNISFGTAMPVFTYVLGDQNSAERSIRISNFANAERGVLGNVHVLTEGVDIPIVDSVYFVDPKNSLIDIVQGIGRALRKKPNTVKVAKIIVPVIIPEEVKNLEEVPWDETLSTFHSVIQSMRDQDSVLRQEIDSFNEFAISSGKKGTHISDGATGRRLRIINQGIKLPTGVSINDFLNKITIRIATANANPTGAKMGFSHLGKGERKSGYKPIFGILGDYNPEPYWNSLILPTLNCFSEMTQERSRSELAINHNNVSHAQRLGVIKAISKDSFALSEIGVRLKNERVSFEDLFQNQMMLFSQAKIFSYRVVFEMLLNLKSLDHVEFLFGPYIMQSETEQEMKSAIRRIELIRENYPALELTSLSNREAVTAELNMLSSIDIPQNEIWGDRSTPKNKFRYLANSITLFDFFDVRKEGYKEPIKIRSGSEQAIIKLLQASDPAKSEQTDYYGNWWWMK
jgi:superfamily II DNA or RNA helicase